MADKKGNEGGFGKFLYNSDTGEVLGRTGSSWAKIIAFYIVFYAGLAAFFGLLLYIALAQLDPKVPKYQLGESLIGTNPGVGFRPQPDQDKNVDSTLIWFNRKDPSDYQWWSGQLKSYVQGAQNATEKAAKHCGFGGEKADSKNACLVNVNTQDFGECNEVHEFGYKTGDPCVLIKLNKIYGWKPEPFGGSPYDEKKLKDEIESRVKDNQFPKILQTTILKELNSKSNESVREDIARSVWINCDGENPADRENMGEILYKPMAAIQSYYFPFKFQDNYVSPFIMVQFRGVKTGVLINIECKAYANNIFPDRASRTGSVHFEIMVE